MWLSDFVTKNTTANKQALCGSVIQSNNGTVTVVQSCEHLKLPVVAPFGIAYSPPAGENSVVLPLQDKNICIGVIAPDKKLAPGELMLYSAGGSYILLKNDGTVSINGQIFGG